MLSNTVIFIRFRKIIKKTPLIWHECINTNIQKCSVQHSVGLPFFLNLQRAFLLSCVGLSFPITLIPHFLSDICKIFFHRKTKHVKPFILEYTRPTFPRKAERPQPVRPLVFWLRSVWVFVCRDVEESSWLPLVHRVDTALGGSLTTESSRTRGVGGPNCNRLEEVQSVVVLSICRRI